MESTRTTKKRKRCDVEQPVEDAISDLGKPKKRKRKCQGNAEQPPEQVPTPLPATIEKKKKKKKRTAGIVESEAVQTITKRRKKEGSEAGGQTAVAADNVLAGQLAPNSRGGVGKRSGRKLGKKLPEDTEVVPDVAEGRRAKIKRELAPREEDAVPAPEAAVGFTVFVDGVPYAWDVSKVEDRFRECGEIKEVRAPVWQDSGRLRGFAHVTFVARSGRDKALALDGTRVDKKGRYLKIEKAKAPAEAAAPAASDLEGKRRLFVKNLPYDATEGEIGKLFAAHGKVREVRVPTSFGRSKGFAYVEFAKAESLKAAVEARPPPALRGRTLRLDADSGSGPKAGFHFRKEAFDSSFGPGRGGRKGGAGQESGRGKGGGKGRGPRKLSLF